MQPRISIIVPCYNGEKYLRETLDCLQNQTIEDWECVIVNDGSTDGSLEIMKEYATKDPRYKYIDKENGGPSIARNIAIGASSGKYILPLDADDLIAPSYAEKAINYLDNNNDTKLVYSDGMVFGTESHSIDAPDYSYENIIWKNSFTCSCVFRKKDFDKTTGYNPNMKNGNEDWDFWLCLLSSPEDKVYKIRENLFFYRFHGISRTSEAKRYDYLIKNQMIMNHIDRYEPYLHLLIDNSANLLYYKNELSKLTNSKSFKLYYKIISVFRLIKRFLHLQ